MENKEKLDLVEILKDVPSGTPLYSPIYGEVKLYGINEALFFPIVIENLEKNITNFDKRGRYSNCTGAECMLFPSKDCRDWSQFKVPKPEYEFKPFEKVLVRDSEDDKWRASLFDYKTEGNLPYFVIGSAYKYCIPYEGNEYLHGKTDKPKEL